MTPPSQAGFVAALLAQASGPLREFAGEGLGDGLAAFVAEPWGWQTDAAFATRYHAALPVPGLAAADYLTRLLDTPEGTLLVGIRFRGGDLAFPFVEVLADHLPTPALIPQVAAAYAAFKPRALRLWRLGPAGPNLAAWPQATLDQAYWAGRVSAIQARPRPARYGDLAVTPAVGTHYRPRLDAAYAAFHAEAPHLAADVSAEDEASLGRAAAVGLLLEAHVDGVWAGMVGAAPDAFLGLRGWLVLEEILAAPFRGRGLGAALQRHLVDRLPGDGVLYGTIAAANLASARTAAALGRQPVAETWWVGLPG